MSDTGTLYSYNTQVFNKLQWSYIRV